MKDELNMEELERVNDLINKESSYKNKDIYRKDQIEELKELREEMLKNQSKEGRRR